MIISQIYIAQLLYNQSNKFHLAQKKKKKKNAPNAIPRLITFATIRLRVISLPHSASDNTQQQNIYFVYFAALSLDSAPFETRSLRYRGTTCCFRIKNRRNRNTRQRQMKRALSHRCVCVSIRYIVDRMRETAYHMCFVHISLYVGERFPHNSGHDSNAPKTAHRTGADGDFHS